MGSIVNTGNFFFKLVSLLISLLPLPGAASPFNNFFSKRNYLNCRQWKYCVLAAGNISISDFLFHGSINENPHLHLIENTECKALVLF